MNKKWTILQDTIITAGILGVCLAVSLGIRNVFHTMDLIPTIFVLAVFLISLLTEGFYYGIFSALFSVMAVNYAFTFPLFTLNFSFEDNLVSGCIMLTVTICTCALTRKIKHQELFRAETEKERMRANLLRAVSHDLRTPLTTIYGSSSALIENHEILTEDQKLKMIRGIRADAEWLTRMVENLLSVTRLGDGDVHLIKTPIVLEELLDSVLVAFHKHYPGQEVSLVLPDEMILVPMDPLLIQQVLINLLENAVRHAKGMTSLSLRVSVTGGKALFEVIDDGCGIDQQKVQKLFEDGFGVESFSGDKKENTAGIGLSVCATVIRAHGGQIYAVCNKDRGATFSFTLNLEDSDHE